MAAVIAFFLWRRQRKRGKTSCTEKFGHKEDHVPVNQNGYIKAELEAGHKANQNGPGEQESEEGHGAEADCHRTSRQAAPESRRESVVYYEAPG